METIDLAIILDDSADTLAFDDLFADEDAVVVLTRLVPGLKVTREDDRVVLFANIPESMENVFINDYFGSVLGPNGYNVEYTIEKI